MKRAVRQLGKTLASVMLATGIIGAVAVGCSNPAVPKDCIKAAEEAGAPPVVLEYLNNPTGDLNQATKFAIRQFLNRTQLNDVCGSALETLD